MQTAENHQNKFIKIYCKMSIIVNTVTIYQNFFILEKSIVKCLLEQSYENAIKIIKKTQNDKSVHIIMFNLKDDIN